MIKNKLPTNRNFGIVFFVFFLLISLWLFINNKTLVYWPLIISIVFLILGLLNAKILTPLNKAWIKFGEILGSIISPLVMGIIFFGIVTPTGLFLKLIGKDVLKLKQNKKNTYWIEKDNSNNSMKNQF